MRTVPRVAAAVALAAMAPVSPALAATVSALFPLSLQHASGEIIRAFEQASGNKVKITYGTAGAVAKTVQEGGGADVVVSAAGLIDGLKKQGKVVDGSIVGLVKVGVGLLVRNGAPKPDISTVDKFKSAMLSAKAITYTDPALGGPAGIYVAKMFDTLGIGAEMKAKTKLAGPGAAVSTAVVKGKADIGFIMINEILADPRVDYAGPLPQPIQNYTKFSAAIVAASAQQSAAKALIDALNAPKGQEALYKIGFEPF
jgi:molybdate transport system substrate-binding protein